MEKQLVCEKIKPILGEVGRDYIFVDEDCDYGVRRKTPGFSHGDIRRQRFWSF